MKNILVEEICYVNGELELADENNKYWGKKYKQTNMAAKMFDYLYKNGKLNDICSYTAEHTAPDGAFVLNMVIDRDALTEEFVNEMEEKFPGNGLKEVPQWSPCRETGLKGIICSPYRTYRDWYGTVGSSFEHPYVQGFFPGTLCELEKVKESKGLIAVAIALIKTCWDEEGGCHRETAEEYEKAIEEYEKAVESMYEADEQDA